MIGSLRLLPLLFLVGCEDWDYLSRSHNGGMVSGGPFNYVFVTSQSYSPGAKYQGPGSLSYSSVEDADQICHDLASASSVAGVHAQKTYVAWLSTSSTPARNRLRVPGSTASARGWQRPDGRPFSDSLDDLTSQGKIFFPPRLDENGSDVVGGEPNLVPVATGTQAVGTSSMSTAMDWTSSTASYSPGHSAGTTGCWTDCQVGEPVSGAAHLYCLGVDFANALLPSTAVGRHAFVSKTPFSPPTPLSDADMICNEEAKGAGLSGDYLALLSTTSQAAAERFDLKGPTWVRLDGIPWLDRADALAEGQIVTTLNVDSTKLYQDSWFVWSGSGNPGTRTVTPSDQSCNDWTSGASKGQVGRVELSNVRFFNQTTSHPCGDSNAHVYCLER